jgi:hypothetical protein
MTASLGSLRICKVVFHATFFLIRQKLSKTKIKIVLIDSNFSPSPPTSPCWPHKIDAIRRRVNHDTNILKMAQRFTFHKYSETILVWNILYNVTHNLIGRAVIIKKNEKADSFYYTSSENDCNYSQISNFFV